MPVYKERLYQIFIFKMLMCYSPLHTIVSFTISQCNSQKLAVPLGVTKRRLRSISLGTNWQCVFHAIK